MLHARRRFWISLLGVVGLIGCGRDESLEDTQFKSLDLAVDIPVDKTRRRELAKWNPGIQGYSQRHYRQNTWQLAPSAIVLHYTAGKEFPWNLVTETEYNGEKPGRGCHYVVEGTKIFELLPPTVRARCAHGANHAAISIEIVAENEDDLFVKRHASLEVVAKLVTQLVADFKIPLESVHSHEEVDRFDGRIPWVFDLTRSHGTGKPDPGAKNMLAMITRVRQQLGLPVLTQTACPTGFKLEHVAGTSGGMACVSLDRKNMAGPFTSAMIENCKKWSAPGTAAACLNSTWSLNFALDLRGKGLCPVGAFYSSGKCEERNSATVAIQSINARLDVPGVGWTTKTE